MFIIVMLTGKLSPNGYKSVTTCEELIFMYQSVTNSTSVASLYTRYPACSGWATGMENVYVIVNVGLARWYQEEKTALLNMAFGVSGWAGLVVNILGVEWWLNVTREEDEGLKKVSLVRRRAAGLERS
jgi:hypothetical protein